MIVVALVLFLVWITSRLELRGTIDSLEEDVQSLKDDRDWRVARKLGGPFRAADVLPDGGPIPGRPAPVYRLPPALRKLLGPNGLPPLPRKRTMRALRRKSDG